MPTNKYSDDCSMNSRKTNIIWINISQIYSQKISIIGR